MDRTAVGTALLVALVVASTAGTAAAATAAPPAVDAGPSSAVPALPDHDETVRAGDTLPDRNGSVRTADTLPDHNETARTADTAYVTDDGDVILAYRDDATETESGRFGVNVSEGLLHLLVRNETASNVTGSVQATMNRTELAGGGSITADRPPEFESLSLQGEAFQTADDSYATFDFSATVTNGSADRPADAGSLSTEGTAEVGPESYEYSASVTVEDPEGLPEQSAFDAEITETETGYRVSVERERTISNWTRSRWDTRENATETLEAQYGGAADSLNGTSEVRIRSYEFTSDPEDGHRLSIAYTVEYRGIHDAVAERLTDRLADQQNLTLTEEEAAEVSEKVEAVTVDTVAVQTEQTDGGLHASVEVRLDDYDELSAAMLDVAAAQADLDEQARRQIAEARAKLDARRAAGLTRTTTWSGSVTRDGETVSVAFTLESRTDNWAAYVEELAARDVQFTETQYEVVAETDGDEIHSEVSLTVADDDLLAELTSGSSDPGVAADDETAELVADLREAGFRRAAMNATLAEDEVTLRSAAKFENASAIQAAFSETYDGEIASVAGRADDGEQVTYVRLNDAVDPTADESAVRELAVVDEDTEVRMPDDWNRTFPRMDTESVETYLGYEQDPATNESEEGTGTPMDDGDSLTDVPGFGIRAAFVGLVAAVVALARRER